MLILLPVVVAGTVPAPRIYAIKPELMCPISILKKNGVVRIVGTAFQKRTCDSWKVP